LKFEGFVFEAFLTDIPISLSPNSTNEQIVHAIDAAIAEVNLTVTMRDTLKKYPGSVHWHLKNRDSNNRLETGTLEVTFWPQKNRAWFTIQDGRKARWIDEKLKLLKKALQFKA
jgi:hypothetical protein